MPAGLALIVLTGLTGQAAGPQAAPPQPAAPVGSVARPWTAEDIVFIEEAGQFRLSPDARRVVWVKDTADKDKDGRVSNLMLTVLDTRRTVELTRGADRNRSPRWSPDGERMAFLSTRARRTGRSEAGSDTAQVWLIDAAGGEAWPATEQTRDVKDFDWLDNDTIVFSAEEDPSLYEKDLENKKDKSQVVEDEVRTPPVRLFSFRLDDKRVTRLTTNTDWIDTWQLSPNGGHVVARHQRSLRYRWDQKVKPAYWLHDLSTGTGRQIFADGRVLPETFRWLPDSSAVLAVAPYTTDPRFIVALIVKLHLVEVGSGRESEVDLGWERGLGGNLETTPDGFVALLADGIRNRLARYSRAGTAWTRADLGGDHVRNIEDFTVSRDGRTIVYSHSTASVPAQVFAARLESGALAAASQISDLNPRYKQRTIARTEVVRWRGAGGDEVEGLLYYPHRYEAGRRYPLVTAPHGGPFGADLDLWDDRISYPNNLFAQRGAFVLRPNYHGSSSYGLAFAESICCGKYYELPVTDIEAGVDALIERGLVDPDRVGTMGWSNGAILSVGVMLANPGRYKAGSAGAGDVEWISDWANVDFGHSFDTYYFGASPLEDPQRYIEMSPLFRMDRIQTPTLIFFGTEDRNVPTDQGWSHFRALQHVGKVPVRFVLFPGEPHGLRKVTHQVRKLEEEMAWFDRYLFRTETPVNEALKKDSPLARALRRKAVKVTGASYGIDRRGVLVPEVVARVADGRTIEIGRFEVTRAQFAAFDRSYQVTSGTANRPASGVTFEQAMAYTAWLRRQTGERWRLLREAEAAALYAARQGENTLDYWAGYAPNPDDASRLEARIAELGPGAPLLEDVGSHDGAGEDGEDLLFDLGGNVAEWIEAVDGSAKAVGGSADRPADPKAASAPKGRVPASTAAPEYVGFRVVREARP